MAFFSFPERVNEYAARTVIFATLEAAVPFCMGCWVYGRLQAAGVFPADACVDCAPQGSAFKPAPAK